MFEKSCTHCHAAFISKTNHRKYCSPACGQRGRKWLPNKIKPKNCQECGDIFTPATRDERLKFCSKVCKNKSKNKKRGNEKKLGVVPYNYACAKCKRKCYRFCEGYRPSLCYTCETASVMNAHVAREKRHCRLIEREILALRRIKRKANSQKSAYWRYRYFRLTNQNCINCGCHIPYTVGERLNPRLCCQCRSSLERARSNASKTKRRQRMRKHSDLIDPIKVFERDKWVCHLCKKKTSLLLRGTIEPLAPELDHIISLADGGLHTWGNVACACRQCNNKKSSKSIGQLGLGFVVR